MAKSISSWLLPSFLVASLPLASPAHGEIAFAFAAEGPAGSSFVARVTGEITAADYQALRQQADQAAQANVRQMQLDSSGGNLEAALAIGRLIRSLEFGSMVLSQGRCDSACVFILAAGIDKVVEGEVGIHRPYFIHRTDIGVREALRIVKAETEAYLVEMNIPASLAEDMFSVDPGSMRTLTGDELAIYRLNSMDYVAREERAQRLSASTGLSREAYEVFRQDLNYSCRVFGGMLEALKACVDEVAARHGISL